MTEAADSIGAGQPMASAPSRSSMQIMLAVWRAMFLRLAVSRLSAARMAWFWILFEPVAHMALVMFLFTTIRMRVIPGAEVAIWIVIGLTAYHLARKPMMYGLDAISGNMSLFAYRQVRPVDAVLVATFLEAYLATIVLGIILFGAGLIGLDVIPDDPIVVLLALLGMWLNGVAIGLIISVIAALVRESRQVFALLMGPLYLLSGVIFPLSRVPEPYREWLFVNPLAHGVELSRQGFFDLYHAAPEASLGYLYGSALPCLMLGLALHVRYAAKIVAR